MNNYKQKRTIPSIAILAIFLAAVVLFTAAGALVVNIISDDPANVAPGETTAVLVNADLLKSVRVEQGSKIEFVVKGTNNIDAVQADLSINYLNVDQTDTAFAREMVSIDKNYKVVLPSGWSLVAHSTSDYNTTVGITTLYEGSSCAVGPGAEGGWLSVDSGFWWGSSPQINWLGKGDRSDSWGPWMGLTGTVDWNTAYCYTSPYAGRVDISIDVLRQFDFTDYNPSANSPKYIAIFVDGVMVWPTAGGSYTDTNDWVLDDLAFVSVEENA